MPGADAVNERVLDERSHWSLVIRSREHCAAIRSGGKPQTLTATQPDLTMPDDRDRPMPLITATVECPVHPSFRVSQVAGMFDLPAGGDEPGDVLGRSPRGGRGLVDRPDRRPLRQRQVHHRPQGVRRQPLRRRRLAADRAVIDGFGDLPVKQVTHALTAVGFSSPPAWVKPYAVLSNGEKFRCDLARSLLAGGHLVVFDEFTSVVDRTVAKVGSAAVAKAIGPGGSTDATGPAAGGSSWRSVVTTTSPNGWSRTGWWTWPAGSWQGGGFGGPQIRLELFRCHRSAWRLFARHHYLNADLHPAAQCYLATWDGQPVALCAVLPLTGRAGRDRVSRIVVLPDYQGLGIGTRVLSAVADLRRAAGRRVNMTTSHPSMIAGLGRSRDWRCVGGPQDRPRPPAELRGPGGRLRRAERRAGGGVVRVPAPPLSAADRALKPTRLGHPRCGHLKILGVCTPPPYCLCGGVA